MTINDLKKLKIPDSSGVYLFEKGARVLYVGKATTLKDRVRSYFSESVVQTRGQIVAKGAPEQVAESKKSYTAKYLKKVLKD
jgi:excinuclease UvrABC nuclease subunit